MEEVFPRERQSLAAPPEYLFGRNRAKISISFLLFLGARKRKIVRENFCEIAAVAIAEAGGGARAYDFVQNHHALRACVRRSVQNMFERSCIIPYTNKNPPGFCAWRVFTLPEK
jgi:hypothetical protein